MHERTNKPTNKQTNEPKSPSVLLDIVFFGAAAKKKKLATLSIKSQTTSIGEMTMQNTNAAIIN